MGREAGEDAVRLINDRLSLAVELVPSPATAQTFYITALRVLMANMTAALIHIDGDDHLKMSDAEFNAKMLAYALITVGYGNSDRAIRENFDNVKQQFHQIAGDSATFPLLGLR